MAEEQLSAEDQAWLDTPVDVQVPPDEQRWLDTMLEMKQDEIIQYAVFNYGLEEPVARAASRNGLLVLIITANHASGGASVLKARYRYLPLKGILPAVLTVRKSGRHLYLTRGTDNAMEVMDKRTGEWIRYSILKVKTDTAAKTAAQVANQPAAGTPGLSLGLVLPMLPKMNREQLNAIAAELKIDDAADIEKFPNNKSLAEAIETKAKEQGVQTNGSSDPNPAS